MGELGRKSLCSPGDGSGFVRMSQVPLFGVWRMSLCSPRASYAFRRPFFLFLCAQVLRMRPCFGSTSRAREAFAANVSQIASFPNGESGWLCAALRLLHRMRRLLHFASEIGWEVPHRQPANSENSQSVTRNAENVPDPRLLCRRGSFSRSAMPLCAPSPSFRRGFCLVARLRALRRR